MCHQTYRFAYIEPSLYPWNETFLAYSLWEFLCPWIQFASILLRVLYLCPSRKFMDGFPCYILNLVLVWVYYWFHRLSLIALFSFLFYETIGGLELTLLMVWKNPAGNPAFPGLFFVGRIVITAVIMFLVMLLFNLLMP